MIGSLIALLRDISDRPHYTIKSDRVILENSRSKKVIPIMDVIDASLVDRMVAREYIRQRTAPITARQERRERMKELMRFCSVDIGLTSLTFGLGRSVTDRLPMARYDLVLLRTKSGDHLLSPRYDQDLVETVSRMISSRATS